MPSLSSYTPFESLLFFQFLATLDSRPTNFTPISELLTNNSFVQQNATFDRARLTPQALESLYSRLIQEELQNRDAKPSQHGPNGFSSDSVNPKKRKIQDPSALPLPDGAAHSTVIPALVSRLYARYKERVTREIEEEERKYTQIRDEIKRLENGEYRQAPTIDGPSATIPEHATQTKSTPTEQAAAPNIKIQAAREMEQPQISQPSEQVQPQGAQVPKTQKSGLPEAAQISEGKPNAPVQSTPWLQPQLQQTQVAQLGQPAPQNVPPRTIAPNLANGNIPAFPPKQPFPGHASPYATSGPGQAGLKAPAGPQIGTPGPNQAPPTPTPQPLAPQLSGKPSLQPMPAGASQPKPTATFQPVQYTPPGIQTSQPSPSPNFQQPWPQQQKPPTPYAHISPYANVPYSNGQLTGRSPLPLGQASPYPQAEAKPFQSPYAPQEVPRQAGLLQQQQQNISGLLTSRDLPVTPAGSVKLDNRTPSFSTSLGRRPPRPSLDTSGSLTPWKSPGPIVIAKSPCSPTRPRPEDISPISERAPSPTVEIERYTQNPASPSKSRPTDHLNADLDVGPAGGTRKRKTTPALRDRPAGSPLSSPARATRNRSRALSNVSRDDESVTDSASVTQRKIKAEMPSTPAGIEDEIGLRTRYKGPGADEGLHAERIKRKRGPSDSYVLDDANYPSIRQAPQYVQCTRNFPRTCAPIMNDIAAHKHASIFAKPLTERDAPGYRNLIYRPQDIKSIKSSIHQGTKAVAAAAEAVNTPNTTADIESPGPANGIGTPSSKSNGLLLKRTPELLPPKGIINSAQLEMELIRMFANAVMFNPTPEKTFGPAFPMQTDAESREGSAQVSDIDEGGIINDTLEMYDDVEKAVSRWRAAERAVAVDEIGGGAGGGVGVGVGGKGGLSLRRGSVSDVNMDSADEVK
ncbi:hypothetical protein FQN55_008052 [Onygenales sp. PD_40]|nr:hypothetical protein FQN55_008052 [Onygenales sp. PD_40]KAK2774037.1 hypothetical protein FQN52_004436 [Onygenales sp. PD_12]KAK2790275.1 hypothetical protein FQN53_000041 [Emmonsiellopsis sp. PD_33]